MLQSQDTNKRNKLQETYFENRGKKNDLKPIVDDKDFIEDDATELIIFEENLTAGGLDKIIEESKTWPITASNKADYDLVYKEHQRFKRLELACRKKATDLEGEEKSRSRKYIAKIRKDLEFVQGILKPLILQLGDSRQRYDDETEAYKMNAAIDMAVAQEKEFKRQEMIRLHVQALDEDALFDHRKKLAAKAEKQRIKDKELAAAEAELRRDRYEFECEKSRLSFDEAWGDAHIDHPDNNISDEQAADNFVIAGAVDIQKDGIVSNIPVKKYGPNLTGGCVSSIPDAPLQDLADLQEKSRANIHPQKVVNDQYVDDEPVANTGSVEKIILIMEPAIAGLKKEHSAGIEDLRMHAELGNLIARIKMNFGIFKDAVNEGIKGAHDTRIYHHN